MRTAIAATLLLITFSASAQLAEGDSYYAKRAEGHQGPRAVATTIDAAIAAYQKAVAAAPDELLPRARLLAAIRFKGAYVARTNEEKKAVYAQGKKISGEAMAIVEKRLRPQVSKSSKESEVAGAAKASGIPHVADIFYWDSVLWGEWAVAYGKMAALKEGAADRIKRSATVARLIDSRLESGGPSRVLGRLHNQTPRVPFITGWASDKEAVKYLRESLAIDPAVKTTRAFLAEALYAENRKNRAEAEKLLREVLNTPNDPEYLVENLDAQESAKALLKQWGG